MKTIAKFFFSLVVSFTLGVIIAYIAYMGGAYIASHRILECSVDGVRHFSCTFVSDEDTSGEDAGSQEDSDGILGGQSV